MNRRQRLSAGLASVGVTPPGDVLEQLEGWLALHARWSRRMNLTGARTDEELIDRHLVDSAAIVRLLPAGALADVGSGAGLPGLVVAMIEPHRPMFLLEPLERRAAFLQQAVLELGLGQVQVVAARSEQWQPPQVLAGVLARAVAPLSRLVSLCAPLLGPGTPLLAMKGPGWRDELLSLAPGWRLKASDHYRLPGREYKHVLLRIEQEEGV
ncbi:MAG: 16S rRNA (guanine(527)-N(7))-methyltransferase RsmG [Gammaproteobacteria bacterium]|nr:MAG: 16S rRNA (guanine(527)-N(7))-methyltransferase RsmG [Gammaproteobacteria bacterium]